MARPIGIRLKHSTGVAPSIVLVDIPTRPFPVPRICQLCKVVHTHRVYHLHLESDGTCIVSPAVYERLKARGLEGTGFTFENTVYDPPPIQLGGPPPTVPPRLIHQDYD